MDEERNIACKVIFKLSCLNINDILYNNQTWCVIEVYYECYVGFCTGAQATWFS